jgi:hypothetical protein
MLPTPGSQDLPHPPRNALREKTFPFAPEKP